MPVQDIWVTAKEATGDPMTMARGILTRGPWKDRDLAAAKWVQDPRLGVVLSVTWYPKKPPDPRPQKVPMQAPVLREEPAAPKPPAPARVAKKAATTPACGSCEFAKHNKLAHNGFECKRQANNCVPDVFNYSYSRGVPAGKRGE